MDACNNKAMRCCFASSLDGMSIKKMNEGNKNFQKVRKISETWYVDVLCSSPYNIIENSETNA